MKYIISQFLLARWLGGASRPVGPILKQHEHENRASLRGGVCVVDVFALAYLIQCTLFGDFLQPCSLSFWDFISLLLKLSTLMA